MTVVPCERDAIVRAQIERFVEALKTEARLLGDHGLPRRRRISTGRRAQRSESTRRRTIIRRDGVQPRASRMTPIRRA
jgi:hypothetical protein